MRPNWANRTIWTGDNLSVMRGMNSESVDLIYLDPPFNSKRDYAAPIGSKAAGAAFKAWTLDDVDIAWHGEIAEQDTWTLDDVDIAWHGEIAEQNPAVYAVIDAAGIAHGKGMKSYLIMMAVRLLEMHRLLKPTGSLYLHCDPTASHYLKMLLDAVFGRGNFRNEIVWQRTSAHNDPKRFGRICDRLLYVAKPDAALSGSSNHGSSSTMSPRFGRGISRSFVSPVTTSPALDREVPRSSRRRRRADRGSSI